MKLILLALIPTLIAAQAPVGIVRQSAVPRQAGPPANSDCTVDGTVLNAVTSEPIARARVTLNAGGIAHTTSSDSSGRWSLNNLPCASAQLTVAKAGYLSSQMMAGSRTPSSPIVTLVSGTPVHDLSTRLTPQSVVLGKVVDDQGEPAQGAVVSVMVARVTDGKLRFMPAGGTNTNDIGEYRIAGLAAGRYIVCVHINVRPGETVDRTTLGDRCYPGPVDGGAASAMSLPAGRETKIDFSLNEVAAVHVRGTITGLPEGRGIGINLIRRDQPTALGASIGGTVRDGKFEFRTTPGDYVITIDYFESGKRLAARVPVNVGASDVDDVAVHLEPAFAVSGVVQAQSQSGAAVPQLRMSLVPTDSQSGAGQMIWDANSSTFHFTDVLPGTYRLQGNAPPPFYIKSATLAGQDILYNAVPIAQAAGPIEITLRDDGGSIDADVADADGQPVAASVMLLRGAMRVALFPAQSSGQFKLRNIAPGDYTICAWDDPNQVQYAEADWMRRNASGCVPISVGAGQNTQIKLVEQVVPAE